MKPTHLHPLDFDPLITKPGRWTKRLLWLRQLLEEGSQHIGLHDDWTPMLFAENRSGGKFCFDIPFSLLNSDEGKAQLARMVFEYLILKQACACHFVATAWSLSGEQGEAELRRYGRVSKSPSRKEVLFLSSSRVGGEDEGSQVCMADIVRTGDRPQLANWIIVDGENGSGAIHDAIRSALNIVNPTRGSYSAGGTAL